MGGRVHLLARRGRFYWRARLPLVLARRLGRTHHGLALWTSARALARRLAARPTAAVETLTKAVAMIAQAPIQPSVPELMVILRAMVRAVIARGEAWHRVRPSGPSFAAICAMRRLAFSATSSAAAESGNPPWSARATHLAVEDRGAQLHAAAGLARSDAQAGWRPPQGRRGEREGCTAGRSRRCDAAAKDDSIGDPRHPPLSPPAS